jgi:hypothetical protein
MFRTDVRLLSPIEVTLDGRRHRDAVASVAELVEGLWGEEPPASATKLTR